jgi:hypothetical protein
MQQIFFVRAATISHLTGCPRPLSEYHLLSTVRIARSITGCELHPEIIAVPSFYFSYHRIHIKYTKSVLMSCFGSFDTLCKRIVCPTRHNGVNEH